MKHTIPLFLFLLIITGLPLYGTDSIDLRDIKYSKKEIVDLSYFNKANYIHIKKYIPSIVIPMLTSYDARQSIAQCGFINDSGEYNCTLHIWDHHLYAYYKNPRGGSHIYIFEHTDVLPVEPSEHRRLAHALNPRNGITYTRLIAANKEIQKLHDAPLLKNQYLTISCDKGLSTYTVSANCMSVTLDEKRTRISHHPRISPGQSLLELLLTSWSGDSKDIIITTVTPQSRCAIL